MSLNVEFQCSDKYDVEYMYRSIFPKEFQEDDEKKIYSSALSSLLNSKTGHHATLKNSDLEFIITGNNNNNETIDMIARPFLVDGKKVTVNNCCEYQTPLNGEFLIELIPKYIDIKPHILPGGFYPCMNNHNHSIFKYWIPVSYGSHMLGLDNPEPMEVAMYLSYSPNASESKDRKPDVKAA